jgi:hypothetical protein
VIGRTRLTRLENSTIQPVILPDDARIPRNQRCLQMENWSAAVPPVFTWRPPPAFASLAAALSFLRSSRHGAPRLEHRHRAAGSLVRLTAAADTPLTSADSCFDFRSPAA